MIMSVFVVDIEGAKYEGIVCERCSIQVTKSIVRRERMEYIDLPIKVVHPWFLKSTNNKISILLDIQLREIKRIANLEKYIVFNPGGSPFKKGDMIKKIDYETYSSLEDFDCCSSNT